MGLSFSWLLVFFGRTRRSQAALASSVARNSSAPWPCLEVVGEVFLLDLEGITAACSVVAKALSCCFVSHLGSSVSCDMLVCAHLVSVQG